MMQGYYGGYGVAPHDQQLGSWLSKALKKVSSTVAKVNPIARTLPGVKHFKNIDKPSPTENALYSSEGELKAAEADLRAAQAEAAAAPAPRPAAVAAPMAASPAAAPLWKNPVVLGGAAVAALLIVYLATRRRDA